MYTLRSFIYFNISCIITFALIPLWKILQTVEHSTFIPVTNAAVTRTDCPLERASLVKIICLPLCECVGKSATRERRQ